MTKWIKYIQYVVYLIKLEKLKKAVVIKKSKAYPKPEVDNPPALQEAGV